MIHDFIIKHFGYLILGAVFVWFALWWHDRIKIK